jgi:enterochelin esterase family protein
VRRELRSRRLQAAIEASVWSSPGSRRTARLPLLLVHDGPEYAEYSALLDMLDRLTASGALPPMRAALLAPGLRDRNYSASPAYARALVEDLLPALQSLSPVSGRPVGMGSSLGALAMLHAQRTWPQTLGGLFLQSGSFFMQRFDRHESGFPRYTRITRFVRGVLRGAPHPDPVPVVMTCGSAEENIHNNRAIAAALAAGGYPATLHEVPDLHNYTGWRDAFDPHLTSLLASLWAER